MKLLKHTKKQQRGMTLLVAMITLIVLMLLGVGAMVASNTMFKLAGNLQFQNEAKNRAESTLTLAENYLMSGIVSQSAAFITPGQATTAQPFYDPTSTIDPLNNWSTLAASSPPAVTGGQFVIQLITPVKLTAVGQQGQTTCMGCPPGVSTDFNLFRVTARGQSGRGATRFVESIVQVP